MLAKFNNTCSNLCWRGCGQVGTLTHMLRSCLSLRGFWASVNRLVADITGILNKLKAEQALLGIGLDWYPPSCRVIVQHILFAARLAIAHRWKDTSVPSKQEVIQIVKESYEYEKILSCSPYNFKQFKTRWSLWETYGTPYILTQSPFLSHPFLFFSGTMPQFKHLAVVCPLECKCSHWVLLGAHAARKHNKHRATILGTGIIVA